MGGREGGREVGEGGREEGEGGRGGMTVIHLSLPLFPFVRGEVMPATVSLPHLLVFSTLLCLVSSSSIL